MNHEPDMNYKYENRDHGFFFGLLAGTAVGAGLALFFAPRVARRAAALTAKGREVRDDVADAVAWGAHKVARGAETVEHGAQTVERGAQTVEHGAHEVERYVTSAETSPITDARKRTAAGRPSMRAD